MGIIIKQSLRNALISYLGIAIGFVSTVKLFPSILETDQFGLTRTLLAIMFIGTQLISLGLPNSIIKFYPSLAQKTDFPKGILIVFFIPILICFLVLGIIFILAKDFLLTLYSDTPLLSEFYLYVLPLIIFSSLFSLLKNYISALFDTVFSSFLQEISQRVVVVLALFAVYFQLINFEIFIAIFVLNYGLQFIILFIYGYNKNFIKLRPAFDILKKSTIKSISNFSFYTFLGGLTMILVGNIDILMIGAFQDLAQTGIYAVALYVGTVISMPRKVVYKISYPIITKAFSENRLEEVKNVYKQTSLNQYLVGLLLYVGIWANIDNLYALLPPEYSAGAAVIFVIGAANLFDLVSGANGQIIFASKYYRFDLKATIFLVILAVTLNLIFIPKLGILGAAIATASSIFLYNVIKLIYVWIRFRMQPFTWRSIAITINGVIVLALSYLIPEFDNLFADILIRSLLMAVVYSTIIFSFKFRFPFIFTYTSSKLIC